MKKKLLSLALIFTLVCSQAVICNANADDNIFTPGTYTETVSGHNGPIEITVTLSNDEIEDITIGNNYESDFVGTYALETTATNIMNAQSVKVDTISGATISSGALIRGVTSIVEKSGCDTGSMPAAYTETEIYEDATCDVVVVGAGSAGLSATVSAYEAGLNVILVEQLGEIGGSSARAGYYVGGSTIVEAANGDKYSTEDFVNMLVTYNPEQEELSEILGTNAGPAIDWLYGMGMTDIYYDAGSIYGSGLHWGNYGRIGGKMCYTMQNQLDSNNIDYRLNTKATSIILENDKAVGITVQPSNGNSYTITADNIILATGGYAANSEMVSRYCPELSGYGYDCSKGSNGSGMLMASEIGAALDGMSDIISYYGLNIVYNYVPRNLTYPYLMTGPVIVNEEGLRFCNELNYYLEDTVLAMSQQTNKHGFIILTENMANQVITPALDYSADLEQMYTCCESLEEAADKFGIDADALKETISIYNTYVENGEDLDFGKPDFAMPEKILDGPLYVAEVTSCGHMTYGGIRVDNQMHVLTENNEIINGLYAAGECTHVMLNGIGTNTISLVEGRLAVNTIIGQ